MLLKRLLFVLLISPLLCIASVRVIESNASRLVFEFDMDGFSIKKHSINSKLYSKISFEDADVTLGKSQEPVLPAKSIYVGVPWNGSARVSFVSTSVRKEYLRYPIALRDSASNIYKDHLPEFINPWLSETEYIKISSNRAAKLILRPIIYDKESQTITVLEHGICTVEFSPNTVFKRHNIKGHYDFEQVIKNLFINYDVAKNWKYYTKGLRKIVSSEPILPLKNMIKFDIGDGHSGYNEGTTLENGMVKISLDQLAELKSGSIRINSVSLYASYKNNLVNYKIDTTTMAVPSGVIKIPLIRVDNNNNGYFDKEDYLIACVSGASDWLYSTVFKQYKYILNRYDDNRHYWLAIDDDGLTASKFKSLEGSSKTLNSFTDYQMYLKSTSISDGDDGGSTWIWRKLSSNPSIFSLQFNLINPTHPIHGDSIKISGIYSSYSDSQNIFLDTSEVCSDCRHNNWEEVSYWGNQKLRLEYFNQSIDNASYMELKNITVKYQRSLTLDSGEFMRIFSPTDSGVVTYEISDLPNEKVFIMRIPQDESKSELVGIVPSESNTFTWSDSTGLGIQYFVCSESALKTNINTELKIVGRDSRYIMKDLRKTSNVCDYLIISEKTFLNEAVRLAKHKANLGKFKNPKVVDVEDVYNQFAGGLKDPWSIRNFLIYAKNFWNSTSYIAWPEYVVLMGNGQFDYKGYSTSEKNFIPPIESKDKCIEEAFTYMDINEVFDDGWTAINAVPDLFIGRFPCFSELDASAIVDKIIEMEGGTINNNTPDFGAWRNRVLLVADDDMQGAKKDPITNPMHYESSELIESIISTGRPSVDIRKVYLYDYEWNEFYEKPGAKRAIINEINNGIGFINYFGHGADNVWADERILAVESISNLTNRGRYPIMASFSCSVGRFDQPGSDCLSGAMVRAASSGAVVAISSTRKAFAIDNQNLASTFYEDIFSNKGFTVGQALQLARLSNNNSNLKTYCLLGDPSIRMSSINNSIELKVENLTGNKIDTIQALQQIKVVGEITNNGGINSNYGSVSNPAFVQIGLYNPPIDSAKRKDGGKDNTIVYSLPGSPVFIGKTTVINGKFEQNIQIPRNLFFNKEGVKLTAYAWDKDNTATGLNKKLIFSGTANMDISDTEGPNISVRPVYDSKKWNVSTTFTDNITASLPLECEIVLYDENGIDVVGIGPDEGLAFEVEGEISRRNINHKFQFENGDFRRGKANITFMDDDLKAGSYKMLISAQDLLGNISQLRINLEIVDEEKFKLGNVFNFPNPFRVGKTTKFYYYHSNTHADNEEYSWFGNVTAVIKIYTLSGKLVRVINDAVNGQIWDGTDQFGNQLPPNVYLYRISTKFDVGQTESIQHSSLKKIVIKPRL